jgi:hypothetical protein
MMTVTSPPGPTPAPIEKKPVRWTTPYSVSVPDTVRFM